MQDFTDKVVVVTGAASGIGRGIARAFAREGARVVAVDVDATGLGETAAEHEAITTELVDVRHGGQMDALAARVEELGGADVVCNNAGMFRGGLIWENPIADWEWVFSVNVYGIVNGLRAFVPRMIANGRPGHIVNTASMAGLIATGASGIYTASKFTAVAISETLAKDLQSVGAPIGVSVLCPGSVNTRIGDSQRNRDDAVTDDQGAAAMDKILSDFCLQGKDPYAVGEMVVVGVRNEQFLIGTTDTVPDFLRNRNDALMRYELPPFQMFD